MPLDRRLGCFFAAIRALLPIMPAAARLPRRLQNPENPKC